MLFSERKIGQMRKGDFSILKKLCEKVFEEHLLYEPHRTNYMGNRVLLHHPDDLRHFFLLKTKNNKLHPFIDFGEIYSEDDLFDLLECGHDFLKEKSHSYSNTDDYHRALNEFLPEWEFKMVQGIIQKIPENGLSQAVTESVSYAGIPLAEAKVEYAIKSFFKRDATLEDKKSAVKALGDLLENVRQEFEENEQFKNAERTIFEILNEFSIRHHNEKQQPIDEPYLTWTFHIILASVKAFLKLKEEMPIEEDGVIRRYNISHS